MYSLELFVITVYCLIADELYPDFCQKCGNPRRAGFSPALTDPECLTLGIVGLNFWGIPIKSNYLSECVNALVPGFQI